MKNIGYKIRKVRELRNFTQEAMAEQIGISQKQYSRFEVGEAALSEDAFAVILKALGVTKETIENFEPNYFIHQNNNHQPIGVAQQVHQDNNNIEEIKNLYERLLKVKDEEIAFLKQLVEQKK